MSDLIDFASPNTINGSLLASPLIPVPESNAQGSNGAGPQFLDVDKRLSIGGNNPFDMVMMKVTEYEKNREDPFERVCEKAMMAQSKDDMVTKRNRRFSDILKMNKTMDEMNVNFDLDFREKKDKRPVLEENDMSIITDLNNTNLIEDVADSRQVTGSRNCDTKMIPSINVFSTSQNNLDLPILNTSALDDSLLNLKSNLQTDFNFRPRSMSQNVFLSDNILSPVTKIRRSLSASDARKNSVFGEDSTFASVHSSVFDDPFNNAFRSTMFKNNVSSNSNYFSIQYDSFISKQKVQRLNSDSSVFSGLSNISEIPMDNENKMQLDRLCSESSAYSGVSNISAIPSNTMSSYESFDYSNNYINKAFLASKSQLNSTNPNGLSRTPSKKADITDLVQKFSKIKARLSVSQIEQTKSNCDTNLTEEKKATDNEEQCSSTKDEKLIDVDNSSDSVFNDETGFNDIIVHEAKVLAETFRKISFVKISKSSDEEELFFSKEQINFEDLPPSDEEFAYVDNLIELSTSPQKDPSVSETNVQENKEPEPKELTSKEKIRALEKEFIEQNEPYKSTEQLKIKFKKNTNSKLVTNKGPLKAVIPVGHMQKKASIPQRMSIHKGNVTPSKSSDKISTLKIASSTPISNTNNNKSKPAASSTPNPEGIKSYSPKIPAQSNKKVLNVTSKSLNSSSKEITNESKINTKRLMHRTLSPQKRPQTPTKNNQSSGDDSSKLPRFSPRPLRVRNYSISDLRTVAKSPQKSACTLKVSSEKKIFRHSSVLSPLKNSNKLASKEKPTSLMSKLRKPTSRVQTGPEKENYA